MYYICVGTLKGTANDTKLISCITGPEAFCSTLAYFGCKSNIKTWYLGFIEFINHIFRLGQ